MIVLFIFAWREELLFERRMLRLKAQHRSLGSSVKLMICTGGVIPLGTHDAMNLPLLA